MIDKTPKKDEYSVVTGRLEYISDTEKENNSQVYEGMTFDSRTNRYDPKIHSSFDKMPSLNNSLKNNMLKSRFEYNQGPIKATALPPQDS